ncbi:MAG: thioredoxin [Eubacterium sp.]|nr:thioredoxin [Eubacterium sp.]
MAVLQIKEDQFEEEVLKSDIPVLVDFWASWCGPCRMLGPIVEELSNENDGEVKFIGVDVDDAERLAVKYGISSIPCLILFKNGEEAGRNIGVAPKSRLAEFIKG